MIHGVAKRIGLRNALRIANNGIVYNSKLLWRDDVHLTSRNFNNGIELVLRQARTTPVAALTLLYQIYIFEQSQNVRYLFLFKINLQHNFPFDYQVVIIDLF